MKTNNPPPMLQRSDQHPQQLVPDITNAQAPGPRVSFEEGQAFMQRAAAQLEVGDQSEEQQRDRVAALLDLIDRDSYERSLAYDIPMSDDFRMERTFMNLSQKKLAEIEFRLSLTPTGVAARYIKWLHDSIGTDAPNPLSGWLKALDAAIHEHYRWQNPHRLFRGAEREVFALVGLYASALLGWVEDTSAALALDVMATASTMSGTRLSPKLAARLAEQRRGLRVWAIVLNIVERDYLKEPLLPTAMRSALDPGQLRFSNALGGSASEAAGLTAERIHGCRPYSPTPAPLQASPIASTCSFPSPRRT
jgi:hypothetical protein